MLSYIVNNSIIESSPTGPPPISEPLYINNNIRYSSLEFIHLPELYLT